MIGLQTKIVLFQNSFVRFLCAGAANTLGTLAIYFLLLDPLSPSLAWAIAFACGIVFVNIVYPRFVFRARSTVIGMAGNTVLYLVGFLVSETLLSGAIQWLELGPRIAGVIVAGMMVPVNFSVARYFCSRTSGAAVSTTNKSDQS